MNNAYNFRAGNIARFVQRWTAVSNDPWVLSTVTGASIPLVQEPIQFFPPFPYRLSQQETVAMTAEVAGMVEKGIVEEASWELGQFVSNVFLRQKANGEFRVILDLTHLNKSVEYEHFKMTSLQTAIDMLRPDCWMGSVDLKDAYYSVPIAEGFRKYLRFFWGGKLYQFVGMPNGLSSAPRLFTKLLAPVYAELRELGHECFPYIDDSFVVADSQVECVESLSALCGMLDSLGFVVHEKKSALEPAKQINFLGFELDSEALTVGLPQEKREKFERAALDVLDKDQLSIREVAGLVGLMVAYSPAVEYAAAHIKRLEIDKNKALEQSRGNFEGMMKISEESEVDILWWLVHLKNRRKVKLGSPDFEIFTDASLEGWGAHRGDLSTGGRWTTLEAEDHINVLELQAILFGLKSLCKEDGVHIRVMTDNTTALAYVKHLGGVKSLRCNQIARKIWDWCEDKGVWITIAHIPGILNTLADFKSRHFVDNTEWELNPKIFKRICLLFGKPEVDLFASRLNKKVDLFVSWNPDPDAWRIDAFTFKWTDKLFYVFPPFSLVARVLQKVQTDGASAIVVVPWWPCQPWFGRLKRLTRRRIYLRRKKDNLQNKGRPTNRDVVQDCPLVACLF